jgi:predicted ATPase
VSLAPPELATEAAELRRRLESLKARAEADARDYAATRRRRLAVREFLDLAPKAKDTLEELAANLFGELLSEIEVNLTFAIQDVLGQNREVKARRDIKNNRLSIHFEIENNGEPESVLHGQGGSVCNILSVGLRLIALSQLDPSRHRPFLVLDEQDCWLKPELVTKFMKLVSMTAKRLGLQAVVISHHPIDHFADRADAVYALKPSRDQGVEAVRLKGGSQDDPQDCEDSFSST